MRGYLNPEPGVDCALPRQIAKMNNTVKIFGQPGGRARSIGLLRAAFPLCAVFMLCGFTAGALIPWPASSLPVKCLTVILAAIIVLISTLITVKRIDSFLKGANGEVAVAYMLARLPDGYSIYHGVDISENHDTFKTNDFDHVILTPSGVAIVETKNWKGELAFKDGKICIDDIVPERQPIPQVLNEAHDLALWLEAKIGESVEVIPYLCFAGTSLPGGIPAEVNGVRICSADTIVNAVVAQVGTKPPLSSAARERISILLQQYV